MIAPAMEPPWFRLGYVSPHPVVDTITYELYRIAPPGIMVVTAGIEIADYTREAVEDQLPRFRHLTELLAKRQAERIVLSGVPLAVALGRPRMRALLGEVETALGIPTDTDLEAIIAAAQHLGLERVALGTRWKPEVNDGIAAYLADAGIEVVATVSESRTMRENAVLDDASGMRLAFELGRAALSAAEKPHGAILPGGRWIAAHTAPVLEGEFGRPVLLNYPCGLWAALRDKGFRGEITGWGRLLGSLSESSGRAT
jgi:maleate cis-trans isomerase